MQIPQHVKKLTLIALLSIACLAVVGTIVWAALPDRSSSLTQPATGTQGNNTSPSPDQTSTEQKPSTPQPSATPNTSEQDKSTPTSTPSSTPTDSSNTNNHYDVVMIGSEIEGLYLARAAADEGLSVKIIDPRDAFGGQLLQGQMLFLDEARDGAQKTLLQGRVKGLFDGFKQGKIRKLNEFEQYVNKVKGTIPVEQDVQITKINTKPGDHGQEQITDLTYTSKQNGTQTISADYWVDNSDYAALISQLKTKRLAGLEKLYALKQIEYMCAGMMMKFKNVDWNKFNASLSAMTGEERHAKYGSGYVNETFAIGLTKVTDSYKPSNERVRLRGLNALHQRNGDVIINALLVYNIDPSKPESIETAVSLGQKETALILEHFRKTLPGWENAALGEQPTYPYIREYNHYETEYVLEASDMLGGKMFWDNVSIAGYPLDLQGVTDVKGGIEMGRPDKYGMPLRSFLLPNYDNVITAGKNVGSSAIAYGSARIQPNTSIAAESIGVILGQIKGKKKLKDLKEQDMTELHQYLASRYQIKLTGVKGENKLAGWTEDEIAQLNDGKILFPSYSKKRVPAKKPAPSSSTKPSPSPSPTAKPKTGIIEHKKINT
ncbi:FAD-dependent oxidoreductase [Paenibacillus sp. N1-5-1-14]|uniref:FAD-dependent oxidoreductase n=1 Tax=Paenibacillus radicibacter TaxID=2972488 RepID=UPI0021598779|nr:FAD-dependent oxidoreductase [Paenibacillus radicibacter]MCR8645219.1 FAD-dependent oxidoreductase [Paenibacillus radicibacter]